MTLDDIEIGKLVIINRIDTSIHIDLERMGILEGEQIYFEKSAPFKDPKIFSIQGNLIALRRSEAKLIEVSELE
ncbi:MAG: hypothetical protein Kow0079_00750 [Vicingaceae bacterium]|jgi:Fe2+ transport system protein FeoA